MTTSPVLSRRAEELLAAVKVEHVDINQFERCDLGTDGLAVEALLSYLSIRLERGKPLNHPKIMDAFERLVWHGYYICVGCNTFHVNTRACS